MAKIYLETSFVSYLVARPSRDVVMAARQQLTLEWWDKERLKHELYASDVVLEEAPTRRCVGDHQADGSLDEAANSDSDG